MTARAGSSYPTACLSCRPSRSGGGQAPALRENIMSNKLAGMASDLRKLLSAVETNPREYPTIHERCESLRKQLTSPKNRAMPAEFPDLDSESRSRLQNLLSRIWHPGPFWFLQSPDEAAVLLRDCLSSLEQPWRGNDWDALSLLLKGLLSYMRRRERASLIDVFENVWYTDTVNSNALNVAVSKANKFLMKRGEKRILHKPRGEEVLTWE